MDLISTAKILLLFDIINKLCETILSTSVGPFSPRFCLIFIQFYGNEFVNAINMEEENMNTNPGSEELSKLC